MMPGTYEPIDIANIEEIHIHGEGPGVEIVTSTVDDPAILADGTIALVTVEAVDLISAAGHSGALMVCNGNINDEPTVVFSGASLTDADTDGITASNCHLHLSDSSVSGSGGIGVSVTSGHLHLSDSSVSGSGGIGVSVSQGDLVMERCEVRLNDGGGVFLGSGNGEIYNNVLVQNGSGGSSFGGFNLYPNGGSVSFWNNTVAANYFPGDGKAVICTFSLGDIELHNSIFTGTDPLLSSDCLPNHSFVEDGSGAAGGTGNITTGEAGYADAPNGDYHLAAGSQCIDSGDPATDTAVVGFWDIDGDERIQGGRVDIGADEAQ
jgi:hypothetical protein